MLVGVGVSAFLLVEPHFEGRNANATLFQIYFNDAFLVYAYVGSIAFFVGLYQAFRLLGNIRCGAAFVRDSVQIARIIRNCALTIIGFTLPPVAYLFIVRPEDDIAGGIVMGFVVIFISSVVAAVASALEGILQKGVDR